MLTASNFQLKDSCDLTVLATSKPKQGW